MVGTLLIMTKSVNQSVLLFALIHGCPPINFRFYLGSPAATNLGTVQTCSGFRSHEISMRSNNEDDSEYPSL